MEQVLVVDRAAFFGGAWPQGFLPLTGPDAALLLERAFAAGRFEPRAVAEQQPAWKQWIPYCVLRCARPGAAPDAVYLVQRTKGGETRLDGAFSIGLGGHVEPVDRDAVAAAGASGGAGAAFFATALARELAEELVLRQPLPAPRFVGLLNDDATAVGQVHAGLVYVCDLEVAPGAPQPAIAVREISKLRGGFGSLVELRRLWQDPARFESWSQFLIQAGVAGPMGDSEGSAAAARAAGR